jgi:Rha family phage regulatory protein
VKYLEDLDMTKINVEYFEASAKQADLVEVHNGKVIADSRKVAEVFGKKHQHVLRDIRELECPEEFSRSNFGQCSYINDNNREMPMVSMTRDGFSLLVMGFTGKKAAKWKILYIEAFNKMEAELLAGFQMPKNRTEALALALEESKRADRAEHRLELAKPKLKQLDRIDATVGSMTITEAAKTLRVGPKSLFSRMNAEGWIYRRTGGKSWIGYQNRIDAGLLEHKERIYQTFDGEEGIATQVKVTGKGLIKLAEILNQPVVYRF